MPAFIIEVIALVVGATQAIRKIRFPRISLRPFMERCRLNSDHYEMLNHVVMGGVRTAQITDQDERDLIQDLMNARLVKYAPHGGITVPFDGNFAEANRKIALATTLLTYTPKGYREYRTRKMRKE